ncbi:MULTISPECIES: hypothetical protein [unclassified Rhizobium]|uniref:hypothetical protein n=1 Tax=unclassified Rhizobium TaxID=2613769 RepID=UPI00161296A1|nr:MULTISPECIES: hypothetical protein [unclassified Rhizobium]MBB3545253.1 hypothetical protein [Rhizobium sp. BK399]MCS3743230.1 hypothetical protein [Rhizobium sp. BK661]
MYERICLSAFPPRGVAIRKPVDGAFLAKKFCRTGVNDMTADTNLLLDRETIMLEFLCARERKTGGL